MPDPERERLVRKMNRHFRISEWFYRIADRFSDRAYKVKRQVAAYDRDHGGKDG